MYGCADWSDCLWWKIIPYIWLLTCFFTGQKALSVLSGGQTASKISQTCRCSTFLRCSFVSPLFHRADANILICSKLKSVDWCTYNFSKLILSSYFWVMLRHKNLWKAISPSRRKNKFVMMEKKTMVNQNYYYETII